MSLFSEPEIRPQEKWGLGLQRWFRGRRRVTEQANEQRTGRSHSNHDHTSTRSPSVHSRRGTGC